MVEWMRGKKKSSHGFGGAVEFQKWWKKSLIIRYVKDYNNYHTPFSTFNNNL